MGKVSFSKQKFEEKILNELNFLLRTRITDPRVQNVSLTKVMLNKDYSIATVSWDTFNVSTRGDSKSAITKMTGKLRTELSKTLKLRHTPELKFIYDSQFEDANHITNLLKSDASFTNESDD